jgi:hypothetical protein
MLVTRYVRLVYCTGEGIVISVAEELARSETYISVSESF